MNKKLWGQTTDLSSFPLSHSILKNTVKKKSTNLQMHHSINAARHKCAHKAHFLFTFLFSRSLLFFLISVRSHSVAFSPLYIYILSSIFDVFLLFFYFLFSLHFLAFMLKGGPEAPRTQRHGRHTKTQLAQAAHAVVCRELLASRTEMYYCHSKDELPIQHEFN